MPTKAAGILAADEFERVALSCNWAPRSLAVVRALLIDGLALSVAAKKFKMTPNQASVHRKRFLDKAAAEKIKKVSASDFMRNVKPDGDGLFAPFKRELVKLKQAGYSTEQLLQYLAENGIDSSALQLTTFLGKVSNANHRNR